MGTGAIFHFHRDLKDAVNSVVPIFADDIKMYRKVDTEDRRETLQDVKGHS